MIRKPSRNHSRALIPPIPRHFPMTHKPRDRDAYQYVLVIKMIPKLEWKWTLNPASQPFGEPQAGVKPPIKHKNIYISQNGFSWCGDTRACDNSPTNCVGEDIPPPFLRGRQGQFINRGAKLAPRMICECRVVTFSRGYWVVLWLHLNFHFLANPPRKFTFVLSL